MIQSTIRLVIIYYSSLSPFIGFELAGTSAILEIIINEMTIIKVALKRLVNNDAST